MADSRLKTSLHPVLDLALLPSACVAVIRLRTNERQTRVISQKQLAWWASQASLSIPSLVPRLICGRGKNGLVSIVCACAEYSVYSADIF